MVPDMDKRLIQLQQDIAVMKEQTVEETALQQLATEDERRIYLLLKDVYDSILFWWRRSGKPLREIRSRGR